MNLYNKILHYGFFFVLTASMAIIMAQNLFDVVEINGTNITQAPFNCSTGASSCDLSYQGITSIAPDTFINHTNLLYLDINNNQITSLESGDFNGLSRLSSLNLTNNQISSIDSGDFIVLTGLTSLNLTNNFLTSVDVGDFTGLLNLVNLYLINNRISSVEINSFNGLSNLSSLHLSNNKLAFVGPLMFNGLPLLSNLYLGTNLISSIQSDSFLGLSGLKILYLSINQITSLESGDFSGLDTLDALYLSNNHVASLESGDFNGLLSLKTLYFNGNQITSLESGDFNGLANLKTLSMLRNQFTSLEGGDFNGLPSLYELRLDINNIVSLESITFDQSLLPNLGVLSITNHCVANTLTGYYSTGNLLWSSNNDYCAIVNTSLSSEFIDILTGKAYVLSGDFYVGEKYLNFLDQASGSLSANMIMLSTGYTQSLYPGRAQVQYTSGTVVEFSGSLFTGVLFGPILLHSTSINNLSGVASAVRFGDIARSISFTGGVATVSVPVPGTNSGDSVRIYFSTSNLQSWTFHTGAKVFLLSGVPYVEFTTAHATDYAITDIEYIISSTGENSNHGGSGGGGSTGGGAGGSGISRDRDICPDAIDRSGSYYDGSCGSGKDEEEKNHPAAQDDQGENMQKNEYQKAYSWAKDNNLTSKITYEAAKMASPITRAEAAKVMSIYALTLQKELPDDTKTDCRDFSDISSLNSDLKGYVKLACELGLMGLESDGVHVKEKFNPYGLLNRAEFGTLLSRLLWGNMYSTETTKYYEKHLQALKDNAIMNTIDTPSMKELRGNVFLMMSRIEQ